MQNLTKNDFSLFFGAAFWPSFHPSFLYASQSLVTKDIYSSEIEHWVCKYTALDLIPNTQREQGVGEKNGRKGEKEIIKFF